MAKNEKAMDGRVRYFGELKAKAKDAILLFRCGDFYEAYYEDAKVVADVCGVTLTRENGNGGYMCVFPHYDLDVYLPKLVRAGKRIAICDMLPDPPKPKRGTTETNNENNNQTTIMEKNLKAADLIGKVIIVGNNQGTITVKSVQDNGMLACEFSKAGEDATTPMAVTLPNLQKMTERGLWKISDANEPSAVSPQTSEVTTEADVQEVQDIVPVVTKKPTPKAEEPKEEKPAAIVKPIGEHGTLVVGGVPKPGEEPKKQDKSKAKTQTSCVPLVASEQSSSAAVSPQTSKGTLTYETYQNKKGKTCAKIIGFKETDKAYVNAAELHGSASWINTKDGKVLYLLFGHRYVEAARLVCEALNAGKSFEDCKAIVDSKPKAETQTSAVSPQTSTEKTYTLDEVATMLGKLLPDGQASIEDIKKLLQAA